MRKVIEWIVIGFFATVALATIFVKTNGKNSKQTGGQQTAEIIGAGSGGLAQVASALEGN